MSRLLCCFRNKAKFAVNSFPKTNRRQTLRQKSTNEVTRQIFSSPHFKHIFTRGQGFQSEIKHFVVGEREKSCVTMDATVKNVRGGFQKDLYWRERYDRKIEIWPDIQVFFLFFFHIFSFQKCFLNA